MKLMKLKILALIILIFFISPVFHQPVLAAGLEDARLKLDQSVDQLSGIKDDEKISEAERLARETEARKQVIQKAIDLSFTEIADLKAKLEKLAVAEDQKDIDRLKTAFLAYLEEAQNYLSEAEARLAELKEPDDVKNLAAELKEYRETIYDARIQNIIDFLLNLQVNELITATEDRWQKIQNDLKRLERAKLIREGQFAALMNRAQKYINDAMSLNQRARQTIIVLQQNQLTQSTAEQEPITTESTDRILESPKPVIQPRELIETSLANLKSSYEIFIKISREVKKTLRQ